MKLHDEISNSITIYFRTACSGEIGCTLTLSGIFIASATVIATHISTFRLLTARLITAKEKIASTKSSFFIIIFWVKIKKEV
jgi:nitrate reductase gamma subunit